MRNVQWMYDSIDEWYQVVGREVLCESCGKGMSGVFYISEEESVCLSCVLESTREIASIQINHIKAWPELLNIEGYTYKYDLKKFNPKSAADEKTYYGFMAQNVKEFLPHAVAQKKVPFRNEFIDSRSTREESGTEELLNVVDYISIVPVIIEAMKEQQLQIEELKSQIAELEKK